MNNKIIYICELGQDVDDLVACLYLKEKLRDQLYAVVLDRKPTTKEEKERLNFLLNKGINVEYKIPNRTKYVFVGGSLTLLNDYLKNHKVDYIFMNGGFVGSNVPHNELEKFKGKKYVRTFNFNCDVNAVDSILKMDSRHYLEFYLIGKNVCHNSFNTKENLWKGESLIINECGCRHNKLQHDMLACHEGLAILKNKGLIKCDLGETYIGDCFCEFKELYPCTENDKLDGKYTKWGSTEIKNQYRKCIVAVDFKENIL